MALLRGMEKQFLVWAGPTIELKIDMEFSLISEKYIESAFLLVLVQNF